MSLPYDSYGDTVKHINRVRELLQIMSKDLIKRGQDHDRTKLDKEEKPYFDEFTPKLAGSTFGSPEYYEFLKNLEPALLHHYSKNGNHHPEGNDQGIAGMTLLDLCEVFVDWKAASERHSNGSLQRSIEVNSKRFNMDPQLAQIFENTRRAMHL